MEKQGKQPFMRVDRMIVRYMLLAAVLVLAVMHFGTVAEKVVDLISIAQPLVIGAVMAYIMNILVKRFESIYFPNSQKKAVLLSRRIVCALATLVMILALIVLLIRMIIPGLLDAFTLISQAMPGVLQELRIWIEEAENAAILRELLRGVELDWNAMQGKILAFVGGDLGQVLSSTVTAVGTVSNFVFNLFLSVIFALLLLVGKEKLRGQFDRVTEAYVKPQWHAYMRHALSVGHKVFSSFIIGQCTSALVLGALCAAGMMILRMPHAVLAGIIMGVTALIPIIGAYAGALISAFLVFTVNPIQALWFLLYITILQQIEGNLIYPRLVGSSVGLPSIWVLVAVTIGGGIAGVGGMLLGVPLMATLYILVQERVRAKMAQNKEGTTLNGKSKENDA